MVVINIIHKYTDKGILCQRNDAHDIREVIFKRPNTEKLHLLIYLYEIEIIAVYLKT
jgi:hypothetical protein